MILETSIGKLAAVKHDGIDGACAYDEWPTAAKIKLGVLKWSVKGE